MFKTTLKTDSGSGAVDVELAKSDAGAGETHEVIIDGRRVEVGIDDARPGEGWLHLHDRVVPYYACRDGRRIQVWVAGRVHAFEMVDASPQRATAGGARAAQNAIKAPMPGSVIRINVNEGESFESGQTIIVLESMKMEMSLTVHHSGRVTRMNCAVGDIVEMGAVLAELEGEKAS